MTLARIDFLDHSEGLREAIACRVYGLILEEDHEKIVIETWTFTDPTQAIQLDEDGTTFTIVKDAITSRAALHEQYHHDAPPVDPHGGSEEV